MPTLEKISIKGFKSIRDVEVELRDINVLIGANGSGKSNFLEVLSFLQAIRAGNLHDYVARAGGAERLLHFGSRATNELEIHIFFESEINQYEIVLETSDVNTLHPTTEIAYFWDKTRFPEGPAYEDWISPEGYEAGISRQYRTGVKAHARRHLDRWRIYHFHDTSSSAPLKKTADLHDNRFLRPDGSNLAAFLYLLREKYGDTYNFIRNTVRLAAPFFDDFALAPQALNEDAIRLEWKHRGTDAYFDVSSLSDGTLRFIALATLLQQPKELRPSVILLDEPELGMHPYAITLLASMVKGASVDTQVILATQSPILLDHFEPEDVLVADRVDGATEFTPQRADKLEVWLREYSLGELWEKNELGGRPAPERRILSK
ncbi:MAG: AAA family ATPase [Chloroflexota bacterium]|nr:AAA family ATPase [Chloroflexota bacterium]